MDYIKEPNLNFPRLTNLQKWMFLPIMFIWWFIQLIIYSLAGGFFLLSLGIASFFEEFGKKSENRDFITPLSMILAPLICPIIWWIRYWKFGEYNTLE